MLLKPMHCICHMIVARATAIACFWYVTHVVQARQQGVMRF